MAIGPGASATKQADVAGDSSQQERLGGARADFVANLGRRVSDLRSTLKLLEAEPDSERLLGDLRRRMHALGAGARLLRFAKLAEDLVACELRLETASREALLSADDLAAIGATLDRAPSLAWGQSAAAPVVTEPAEVGVDSVRKQAFARRDGEEPSRPPESALVVGAAALADALGQAIHADEYDATVDGSTRAPAVFDVERTEDNATAIDLARALAPDVIVVDSDRVGALELVTSLCTDPLTEGVPVVVVGTWTRPEEAAPFIALGVARALPKPVSPDTLRAACAEATSSYVRAEVPRSPLGEVTLDALGARLAEELRRGLCDAAIANSRLATFDLGEGSDVLAALWGCVARIRDLVTIHSEGDVRFAPTGPEGALPLAPWLGEPDAQPRGRSTTPNQARAGELADIEGKVALVADDDPAVTWFLAGVLRAAGARVYEAHDGARALDLAFRFTPDLVVSDVLMPHIDGFALCRALKRDLVLRDVPVILLSWKEDLLQRVRELGAEADGYMRKEASAPAIMRRVREVMRPRQRVGERLAAAGEVRGRLDGLTTHTLLSLARDKRPDSTIVVRDASYLYEIELRAGNPVRATRTAADGTFERGQSVFAALLGVGAGRFVVSPTSPSNASLRPDLLGSLVDQLLAPVANARAAQRLLSAERLVHVERVELAEDRLVGYALSTPEPARSLLRTLAAGGSPRALLTSGQVAPRLLEDVLCDAAAHGTITGVLGAEANDLLGDAVEHEVGILLGVRRNGPPVPLPELDLGPVAETRAPAAIEMIAVQLGEPEIEVVEEEEAGLPAALMELETPIPGDSQPPARVEVAERFPAPTKRAPLRLPAKVEAPPEPLTSLGSLTPPPVLPPAPRAPSKIATPTPSPAVDVRIKRPSAYAPSFEPNVPPPAARPSQSRAMWILFAVAGIVFAIGARLSHERLDAAGSAASAAAPAPAAPASTAQASASATQAAATPQPTATAKDDPNAAGANKAAPVLPQDGPLRATDKVPPGQGMLEVVAGGSDTIYIDGTLVGSGPTVKRALAPRKEPYEVRVIMRGEERVRFVLVKDGRLTRIRIAPPWSR